MLKTRFTELTGCKVPIQMAAIGSLARPPLAAAVAEAGGLGMLQLSGFTPQQAFRSLEEVRKRTRGVFGANFIITEALYPDLEELREVVETASKQARVVEFFYRQPDSSLVTLVHKNRALASWQVGSKDEAIAAANAGCDLIVAQGIEAGGHIRGKIGLLALLDQVLDSVNVPVLAAGGIGSGRAMAAALAAGASGVRVGTRFLVAEESEAHPQYQKALISANPEDTVVTETFSENWPNAPHRVLRSSVEAAQAFKGEIVGQRKLASSGEIVPAKRFESITITRDTTGTIEAMPHWAGESVGSVEKVQPAAAIINELVSEAERLLHSWK
jgi:NAD(P)H-dependent flavin oxidoreductase YrpB (nitropropane dioxygenase family)